MGLETALVAGGSALASGIGGAAKGAKGTPDQVVTHTTTRDIAGPSANEQQLQSSAIQSYLKNQELAGSVEDRIAAAQGLQDQAASGYQKVLNGEAFSLTPQEQQGIEAVRAGLVNQGTADVNRALDDRMRQTLASGAGRGLRGQALGALQGDVLKYGAQQVGDIVRQAQTQAAQAALQLPQQRVQAQSSLIGQGLNLGDVLRQQAIQNRQALSNPALLQSLQNMRLASAGQTTKDVTPGQKGSFGRALLGGVGGAVSGGTSGLNVISGLNNLGLQDQYSTLLGQQIKQNKGAAGVGSIPIVPFQNNYVQFPRSAAQQAYNPSYNTFGESPSYVDYNYNPFGGNG